MPSFLASLLSNDEAAADSIIVGGLLALLGLIGLAVYTAAVFNPITYSTGAAAILGTIGGARRLRDGAPQEKQNA